MQQDATETSIQGSALEQDNLHRAPRGSAAVHHSQRRAAACLKQTHLIGGLAVHGDVLTADTMEVCLQVQLQTQGQIWG